MRYIVLAAALSFVTPGISLAQQSTPTNNPAAHAQPATSANQPVGSGMNEQGNVKPCSHQASGTSDRNGGNEKAAASSSGGNPNGKVSSGAC
jgi:hypothetical protein